MKSFRNTTICDHLGVRTFALLSGLAILLCALPAAADPTTDSEDPFAGLAPLEDEGLDEARGGAVVLPNGMTVDVTGTMRFLVDGQALAASAAGGVGSLGLDMAAQMLDTGRQGPIVNSLDGVSLEHYREINFFISNLPSNPASTRFLPPPVIPSLAP